MVRWTNNDCRKSGGDIWLPILSTRAHMQYLQRHPLSSCKWTNPSIFCCIAPTFAYVLKHLLKCCNVRWKEGANLMLLTHQSSIPKHLVAAIIVATCYAFGVLVGFSWYTMCSTCLISLLLASSSFVHVHCAFIAFFSQLETALSWDDYIILIDFLVILALSLSAAWLKWQTSNPSD